MEDRVVQPYLVVLQQGGGGVKSVKYVESCQYDLLTSNPLIRSFYEIKLDCELKQFNFSHVLNLKFYVCVSMALSESPDPHPFRLKCLNSEIRTRSALLINSESYLYEIDPETMRCSISDLFVLTTSQTELDEQLEQAALKQISEIENQSMDLVAKSSQVKARKEQLAGNLVGMDLNSFRLKLQVIMLNLTSNRLENFLTEPVFTNRIENKFQMENKLLQANPVSAIQANSLTNSSTTNLNNLRILRSSRVYGRVKGGDEMFLLTTYFDPNDIEIEFFQFKNDTEIAWRKLVHLNRNELHSNCAIVFRTPLYNFQSVLNQPDQPVSAEPSLTESGNKTNSNASNKIKVYFRLFRPSTKEFSDKWVFYYCKDDWLELKMLFGDKVLAESRLFRQVGDRSLSKNLDHLDSIKSIDGGEVSMPGKISKNSSIEDEENEIAVFDSLISPYSVSDANFMKECKETQTDLSVPCQNEQQDIKLSLDELLELNNKSNLELTPIEAQLKMNLDNFVQKMTNFSERNGNALLKFARTRSFHELIKIQRFLLNAQDELGNTPMHLSIMYGNFDLLELFVDVAQTIPYQNFINLKNNEQLTPLLVACYLNEIECCEFLLEANADLTLTDSYGYNALHIACKNKNLDLLKLLLKYVEKNCVYSSLNYVNHDGYAPLHLAVLSGQSSTSLELVRELLYFKRLKVNVPDRRTGMTALHYAASDFNLLDTCTLLLKHENIIIDAKSFNGSTPLHMAIVNKNYLIVCLLISNGASLSIKNDLPVHFDVENFCFRHVNQDKFRLLRHCIESVAQNRGRGANSELQSSMELNEGEEETEKSISAESLGVKLSQEVKKIYDVEMRKLNLSDSLTRLDFSGGGYDFQHCYDAFVYAQNDPWMLEIFKNSKAISRDLLEKIVCFETFRKMYFESEPMVSAEQLDPEKVDNLIDVSKKRLKNMEKNTNLGQIKLSEQETCFEEN